MILGGSRAPCNQIRPENRTKIRSEKVVGSTSPARRELQAKKRTPEESDALPQEMKQVKGEMGNLNPPLASVGFRRPLSSLTSAEPLQPWCFYHSPKTALPSNPTRSLPFRVLPSLAPLVQAVAKDKAIGMPFRWNTHRVFCNSFS